MKKLILTLIIIPWFKLSFGQAWQNLTPDQNASFMDLAILDANTCYAVGLKGLVYKTTDGGTTWNQQSTGSSDNITSVYAISGVVYATTESGRILRNSDGASWESFSMEGLFGNEVYFYNSSKGYLTGGVKGKIGISDNAGASWQIVETNYPGLIRKVQFVSETEGFALAQEYNKQSNSASGVVLKTTDGGVSWTKVHEEANGKLNDLNFTSATQGLIVGHNGLILKTTDGVTFSTVASGTTRSLNAVTSTNQYVFYAVGIKGTLLKSTNGGVTWSALANPGQYPYIACQFQGNTGYVLVAGNTLIKTVNGGI